MVHHVQKRPKIQIICQHFYPELISTGQTLTELCEILAELGADVEVVCGPLTIVDRKTKVPRFMKYKNIKIIRVWGTRFPKLSLIGKFLNQITYAYNVLIHLLFDSTKRPVLVVTNPPFLGVICAIKHLLGGKPYIYLVFDVYPETAEKLGLLKENGVISALWNMMNRFILKHASAVIVLGRCMKGVIINKLKERDSLALKTHIIHVWSDDRRIKPINKSENPYIKKWNLEGKFIATYSGNMGRFHDMETIMAAAKELNKNSDIQFLFIGEGHKKKWVENFALKWKLSNCQFHTYVDRTDIGFSLSCADVGLVSLSEGQEGFSVPSKTYGILAAGVPVIAVMSPSSEIAMIIREYECGLVVEPGNVTGLIKTIEILYSDSELRKKMGKNAQKAILNKYNLKNAAVQYLSIIESFQY